MLKATHQPVLTNSMILSGYAEAYRNKRDADAILKDSRDNVLAILKEQNGIGEVEFPDTSVKLAIVTQNRSEPVAVDVAKSVTNLTPSKLLKLCKLDAEKIKAAVKLGELSADEAAELMPTSEVTQIRVTLTP